MKQPDNLQPGDPVIPWPAHRIGRGPIPSITYLPLEEPLSIELNGHQVAVLMRLPGHEKELAVGFCISEGLITDVRAIEIVQHCGQGPPGLGGVAPSAEESRNRVQIRVRSDAVAKDAHLEVARLIRAGCGAGGDAELGNLGLSPVAGHLSIHLDLLLRIKDLLRTSQNIHHKAGGVHGTAIFDALGNLIVAREDIGRHNAVDKVLGHFLIHEIALADKILVSTGRASYEMIVKAVRLGISIVATISACTSLAVQLAEEYNVTLIGYLRGKRLTLYAHPERIILPSKPRVHLSP